MISIDRTASKPVTDQIADQLRYKVASGQYRAGDVLPSTRQLADQIGVSFHSVRKAYQALEREGLLESHRGRGYAVRERMPLGKAERIERGAALVHDALRQLIGLGLEADEVEYLFQEQLDLLGDAARGNKVVFAAASLELADLCAQQLVHVLQQNVESATLADLEQHQDADFIVAPYEAIRRVLEYSTRSDAVGVVTHLRPEVLDHTARLLAHQTIGLITRFPDTIPPLTAQLRQESGFSGQILATWLEKPGQHMLEFAAQVDVLLYTPACRRRLSATLNHQQPNAQIAPVISKDSLEAIRSVLTP